MESKHHDLNARFLQPMQTWPLKQKEKQNPQEVKPTNSSLQKQTQEHITHQLLEDIVRNIS